MNGIDMKQNLLARHLNWLIMMLFTLAFLPSHSAWAKGEVTEIVTELRAATASTYTNNGAHYQWGVGNDLVIKGFVYQGNHYDYQQFADRVEVKRVDNARASGNRCSVFAETSGSSLLYASSYPGTANVQGNCNIGELIASNVINTGALDVFSNNGVKPFSIKNIERVDFILDRGLLAKPTQAELALSGQVVIEKAANNPLQMAAIIALDSAGNPSAYGPLVRINPAFDTNTNQLRYGLTDVTLNFDFLSNENNANPGKLSYWGSRRETLGMVFISQADLGLTTNQRYFGFSIFPSDVNPEIHVLTDPATFPGDSLDSSALTPGDADFFAAFALQGGLPVEPEPPVENQAPIAEDDLLLVQSGDTGTINLLLNDRDPDGDALTATLLSNPGKGSISFENGQVEYTPNPGESGKDELRYSITDGHGGEDVAVLTITIPAVNPSVSGRIATGLQGHGAGSFNLGFLTLLGALVIVRRRRNIG